MDTKFLALSQIRDTTAVVGAAREKRFQAGDPMEYALSAITMLAGTRHEIAGYSFLTAEEQKAAHVSLKTMRHQIARSILSHHPEIERKILEIVLAPRKVNAGPLRRMPREERTVRLLSKFLLDVVETEKLKKRGYFGWDDGRAQAALVIDYAWRLATDHKEWRTQKPKNLLFAARFFTRSVFREFSDNIWVRGVRARYFMAWHVPDKRAIEAAKEVFDELSSTGEGGPDAADRQWFAASSLLDIGLRQRDPDGTRAALQSLRQGIEPMFTWRREHPFFTLNEAWSLAMDGKDKQAVDLLATVTRSRNSEIRAKAIPLFSFLGEHDKASTLERQFIRNLGG
jgi:hypothetical protein